VTQNIEEVHVLARGKLAAQHQAAHEMMQKKVLRSALGIIQSLRRSPSVGAVEESKGCFEDMIQSYKEIVVRVKRVLPWLLSSVYVNV
jgi:phage tail tape-measure protein